MVVIQRGQWGGAGGSAWRYQHAPTSLTFVTIANQATGENPLVAGVQITSADAPAGNFGLPIANGQDHALTLSAANTLTTFGGTTGTDVQFDEEMLQSVSCSTTTGSFEAGTATSLSTAFSYRLEAGETLAGFAGRCGVWLDAMGILVESTNATVAVSLDPAASPEVTADAVGAIEMRTDDTLSWIPSASSPTSFTFDKVEFYNTEAMDDPVAKWSVAEGVWTGSGFTYGFTQTPTTALIEITDSENPTTPTDHWYKIWVRDARGTVYVLDPEIINYSRRD